MSEASTKSGGVSTDAGYVVDRVGRQLDEVAGQLAEVLRESVVGEDVVISDLRFPTGAGNSNETLLFTASWQEASRPCSRDMVLRIGPSRFQLFMDPRMDHQFEMLKVLNELGRVRVAEPIYLETSAERFGAPFYLMSQLKGRVPVTFPPYMGSGWLFDSTPDQRRKCWASAVDQLAEIALTPLDKVAFLEEALGERDLHTHFKVSQESRTWAGALDVPMIDTIEEWLIERMPKRPPLGLSWGDARMGNMMFGDDYDVAGVMDWEQMCLGGALLDLGWWLFFERFQSVGMGLERLAGLGDRAETIARWQDRTGIEVENIEWYEVFAGYKLAIMMARKLGLEATSIPGSNANNNVMTRQTAALMGIDGPADIIISTG